MACKELLTEKFWGFLYVAKGSSSISKEFSKKPPKVLPPQHSFLGHSCSQNCYEMVWAKMTQGWVVWTLWCLAKSIPLPDSPAPGGRTGIHSWERPQSMHRTTSHSVKSHSQEQLPSTDCQREVSSPSKLIKPGSTLLVYFAPKFSIRLAGVFVLLHHNLLFSPI